MSKNFLRAICLTLATVSTLSFFVSCGGDQGDPGTGGGEKTVEWRNENNALVFSSGEFDGVFNPFFGTSAYDTSITGQTQIGMISSDETGNNVTFGKDEPVVTLDYSEIMYDKTGNVTQTGDENGTTVYQFVLKDGILFSDGQPLTAHDVLFNMYVYLDPNYTGSSTMYSTDIVGLRNYQLQTEGEISEGAAAALKREHFEKRLVDVGETPFAVAREKRGPRKLEGPLLGTEHAVDAAAALDVPNRKNEIVGLHQIDHRDGDLAEEL